jgi:hypothetical protein
MRRRLLAVLAGTVSLVAWGMVFWGFLASPLGAFHALPDDDAVTRALVDSDTRTGTYFMPWPRDTREAFDAFVAQHRSGPFYRLSFVREGVDPNSPARLMLGTLHYATVAALAVLLCALAGGTTFGQRFAIILVAGSIGTNLITIGDPVWFHMPWDYTRAVLVFEIVAWLLLAGVAAGLAAPGTK